VSLLLFPALKQLMKRGFRRLMNIGTLQKKLQNRSMLYDGVHASLAGAQLMAYAWLEAVGA
jgi:hypothetical protein